MRCSLVEEPQRKRPLARRRNRWEDNIKIHFGEVGCEVED